MQMIRNRRGVVDEEPVDVQSRRRRLTDDELARIRAAWMKRMKDAGSPAEEIASIFRCTARHVRREIKSLEGGDHASLGRLA
jgi:hypothetical protein